MKINKNIFKNLNKKKKTKKKGEKGKKGNYLGSLAIQFGIFIH